MNTLNNTDAILPAGDTLEAENDVANLNKNSIPGENDVAKLNTQSMPDFDLKRFEKLGKRITGEIETIQRRCVGELETLKMENLNVRKENLLLSYKLNKAQYELDNLRNSKTDLMEYVKLSNRQMLQLYSDVLDLHNSSKNQEMVISSINNGQDEIKSKKTIVQMYEQQQARLNILMTKIDYMKNFDYTPFATDARVDNSESGNNSSAFVSDERCNDSDLQLLLEDAEASLLKVKQSIAEGNTFVGNRAGHNDQYKARCFPINGSTAQAKSGPTPMDSGGSDLSSVYGIVGGKREDIEPKTQMVNSKSQNKKPHSSASPAMQEKTVLRKNDTNGSQKQTIESVELSNSEAQAPENQQTKNSLDGLTATHNTLAVAKDTSKNGLSHTFGSNINSLLNPVFDAQDLEQRAQQIPRNAATLQTSFSAISNALPDETIGNKHLGEHNAAMSSAAHPSKKMRYSLESRPNSTSDETTQIFSDTFNS